MKRPNSLHRLVAALAFASLSVAAQAADITVGYQTGIDPTRCPRPMACTRKPSARRSTGAASTAVRK